MNEGLISQRYAKALFRYAKSLGTDEAVYEDMKLFLEGYLTHPDLQKAMLNPVLSARNKELLLSTAIGIEPAEAYMQLVRLLVGNHREKYMRTVALIYEDMYRKDHGIILVKIVTAEELSAEVIDKIKAMVIRHTEYKVEFSQVVDPEIIGGFILKVGHKQLDVSVRREIKRIREELLRR